MTVFTCLNINHYFIIINYLDLLIEGASFLPAKRKAVFTPKHSHLPGSVETAQLVTTTNILEKAPLPPIHNRVIKSLTFEDKSVQRKQIEQSFEVIERPPSRGGNYLVIQRVGSGRVLRTCR